MTLRSRKLEKAIRGRVREELASSPKLLREFNRRRRAWLVARARVIVFGAIGAGVLVGFCVMLFLNRNEAPALEPGFWEVALVISGLIASGFFVGFLNTEPPGCLPQWYKIICFFPVGELDSLRRYRKYMTLTIFLVVTFAFWRLYEQAFWDMRPAAWATPLAAGLALLHGSLAAAAYVHGAKLSVGHRSEWAVLALSLTYTVTALILLFTAARWQNVPDPITYAAFILCPFGWANGAVYWGVLQGHSLAFLLLLPPMAVLAYLIWQIRRKPLRIDGFFDAIVRSLERGTPDPYKNTPSVISPTSRAYPQAPRERADATTSAEPVAVIEARLLGGQWLKPPEWGFMSWLDRVTASQFDSRERVLIEYTHRDRFPLTRQWIWSVIAIIFFCTLGAFWKPPEGFPWPDPIVPLVIGIALLFGLGDWRRSGHHILYPIGFGEVTKLAIKMSFWKCVWLLPVTVVASLLMGFLRETPVPLSLAHAVVPLIVHLGCVPIGATAVFSPLVIQAFPLRHQFVGGITLTLTFLASLFALLSFGVWQLVFLAVLFAASSAHWAQYRRLFNRPGSSG